MASKALQKSAHIAIRSHTTSNHTQHISNFTTKLTIQNHILNRSISGTKSYHQQRILSKTMADDNIKLDRRSHHWSRQGKAEDQRLHDRYISRISDQISDIETWVKMRQTLPEAEATEIPRIIEKKVDKLQPFYFGGKEGLSFLERVLRIRADMRVCGCNLRWVNAIVEGNLARKIDDADNPTPVRSGDSVVPIEKLGINDQIRIGRGEVSKGLTFHGSVNNVYYKVLPSNPDPEGPLPEPVFSFAPEDVKAITWPTDPGTDCTVRLDTEGGDVVKLQTRDGRDGEKLARDLKYLCKL